MIGAPGARDRYALLPAVRHLGRDMVRPFGQPARCEPRFPGHFYP